MHFGIDLTSTHCLVLIFEPTSCTSYQPFREQHLKYAAEILYHREALSDARGNPRKLVFLTYTPLRSSVSTRGQHLWIGGAVPSMHMV